MGKLYLLDVGFLEDTVVYELVPKEVARLKQATMKEVKDNLNDLDVRSVVIDSAVPDQIESLTLDGFNIIKGRLPEVSHD
jgi:hypothetical protein